MQVMRAIQYCKVSAVILSENCPTDALLVAAPVIRGSVVVSRINMWDWVYCCRLVNVTGFAAKKSC